MKIIEIRPREIGFVLWGHCQNLLDDPRSVDKSHRNPQIGIFSDSPRRSGLSFLLTVCLLDNFACFCHLLDFFKINFFEKFVQEHDDGIKISVPRDHRLSSLGKRHVHLDRFYYPTLTLMIDSYSIADS